MIEELSYIPAHIKYKSAIHSKSHVIGEEISANAHYNFTCVVSYNDRVFVAEFVVLC